MQIGCHLLGVLEIFFNGQGDTIVVSAAEWPAELDPAVVHGSGKRTPAVRRRELLQPGAFVGIFDWAPWQVMERGECVHCTLQAQTKGEQHVTADEEGSASANSWKSTGTDDQL